MWQRKTGGLVAICMCTLWLGVWPQNLSFFLKVEDPHLTQCVTGPLKSHVNPSNKRFKQETARVWQTTGRWQTTPWREMNSYGRNRLRQSNFALVNTWIKSVTVIAKWGIIGALQQLLESFLMRKEYRYHYLRQPSSISDRLALQYTIQTIDKISFD